MVELIEFGGERGLVDGGGDHRHRLRLKLHRLADAVGRALHFLDRALDRAVGVDRLAGRLLDRGDLGGDVVGRSSGLRGEALHFLRDDREAAAGIARARRLDRGVEREEVGLARDVADQAEDRFDRFDVRRQRLADLDRLARLVAGAGCDPAATSTSARASSIARMRPAAVCAASRIATADCSAAAATSLVLPSIPRAEAAVERVRSVSAFDWSVLARTSSPTRRSNCSLSRPRRSAASIASSSATCARMMSVSKTWSAGGYAETQLRELVRIVGESARSCAAMTRLAISVARSDIGRDRGIVAEDLAAIFGDRLDPSRHRPCRNRCRRSARRAQVRTARRTSATTIAQHVLPATAAMSRSSDPARL